jgi:hypothetical protein
MCRLTVSLPRKRRCWIGSRAACQRDCRVVRLGIGRNPGLSGRMFAGLQAVP